jgi:hypothetical protein
VAAEQGGGGGCMLHVANDPRVCVCGLGLLGLDTGELPACRVGPTQRSGGASHLPGSLR